MDLANHFFSGGVNGLDKGTVAGNEFVVDEEVSMNYNGSE
jgi:hypothetical protein